MFVRIGKVHGPNWLGVFGSNRRCRHDRNVSFLTRSPAKSNRVATSAVLLSRKTMYFILVTVFFPKMPKDIEILCRQGLDIGIKTPILVDGDQEGHCTA